MKRFMKRVISLVLATALIMGLSMTVNTGIRAATTPTYIGEVIAKKGDQSIMVGYSPTQIKNGAFDVHPNLYIPKSSTDVTPKYTVPEILDLIKTEYGWEMNTSSAWNDASNTITLNKGLDNGNGTVTIPKDGTKDITDYLNGLGRQTSWKTTEQGSPAGQPYINVSHLKDFFEWINGKQTGDATVSSLQTSYGNIGFGSTSNGNGDPVDPCVELNASNVGTLYQDLKTTERDVILWSLSHAGRSGQGDQTIRVIMGPYEMSGGNPVEAEKPSGSNALASEAHIKAEYQTVFEKGSNPQNGPSLSGKSQGGFGKQPEYEGLLSKQNTTWATAKGIYIVPQGTGVDYTRFAFQSIAGNSMGNFLDDVVFSTLAGNLKAKVSGGNIEITGYWGDLPGVSDELIYELFGGNSDDPIATVLLNMKDVPEGPFIATVTNKSLSDSGLTNALITEIKKTDNLAKNDAIPKDYYTQVTGAGPLPVATVKFDTQNEVKNPADQTGFPTSGNTKPAKEPQNLKVGDIVINPATGNAVKLEGWYINSTTLPIEKYNFTGVEKITVDTTLYAKWEPVNSALIFDSNGKTANNMPANQGHSGEFIPTSPTISPSASGYIFDGWYKDEAGTIPFKFTDSIPNDTVVKVYAKWKAASSSGGGGSFTSPSSSVTLNFDTNGNGGYSKPDSQSGNSGFTGKVPSDIKVGDIIDGYQFNGWFKDKEGKEPFDFNTAISDNTTVYAGWEKVDENTDNTSSDPEKPLVKVEFETEIGVPPETQVETPGNTADDPGAPMDINTLKPGTVINGYRFEGWYLDKEYTIKYDFNTPVTENIILYAKWTAVGEAKSPKTGEPISPLAGGVATSLACLAILGLLIRMSAKRRREDI